MAVDGGATRRRRHGRARAGRRRGPRARAARAAARSAPRTRRAGRLGRAAGVRRRQRAVGAGRAARARRGVRRIPRVGYACGRVTFVNEGGTNQEGVYWRYEMWMRGRESALASVTAGNGAIYAVRPEAYIEVDPVMGHDLSFPFNMVKRGWRAVDVPGARATEKMVPSIEGEWARKRRMMSHAWPIVLRGGLLDPRGYPPLYALMVLSHRVLRYATPLLHVVAALATLALIARGRARAARARPGRAAGRRRGRRARRARGRCCSPATTCSRPPRWPPASTTTCATAPRRAGTRRRARGEPATSLAPQARARRRGRGARRWCWPRRCSRWRRSRSGSRAAGTSSTASAASAATACRSTSTSCARWSRAPRRWAPA